MMLSASGPPNTEDKLRRPRFPQGGVVYDAPLKKLVVLETKSTKRPFNLRKQYSGGRAQYAVTARANG